MQNPLDPLGSQDPLGNQGQGPLDDALLDALEHSIENPPGFTDPLAGPNEPVTDDLARQLGEVEANIESAQPIRLEPEMVKDSNELDEQEEEEERKPSPLDDYEPPEVKNDVWGTFQNSPPLPQEGAARTPPPSPPLPRPPRKGGGSIRPRQRLPLGSGVIVPPRRKILGTGSNLRFCPESHEAVNTQECEKCEKYRRWPEGTNEEPRECWYYWQAKPPAEEGDDDSSEEH